MNISVNEYVELIDALLNNFTAKVVFTDKKGNLLFVKGSLLVSDHDIQQIITKCIQDKSEYVTGKNELLTVQKKRLAQNYVYIISQRTEHIEKQLLIEFFNQLSVGVLIQTVDRKTFLANDIAVGLLGKGIIEQDKQEYPLYVEYSNEPYPYEQLPMTLAAKGKKSHVTNIDIFKNNKRIPLEVISAPIYNSKQEIEYLIAIFRDISHQKTIERELQVKTEELITSNEELSQNLEQLRTTQEFMRVQTERLLRKNELVNRFQRVLYNFTKNILPKVETKKQAQQYLSKIACQELNISQCSIWKYEVERQELHLEVLYSQDVQSHLFIKYTLSASEHPQFFQVLHTEDTLIVSNIYKHIHTRTLADTYYKQMGIISVIAVPFFVDGNFSGCICYEQNGNIERTFEPEERYFAKSIADLLVLSIENETNKKMMQELKCLNEELIAQDEELRQSLEELQSAQESLHMLNGILHQKEQKLAIYNHTLSELTLNNYTELKSLDKVFNIFTEKTAKAMNVERVSIWKLSEDNEKITCLDLYWNNQHESGLELFAKDYPNYFRCLFYQDAIIADDARTDSQTAEFTENYLKPFNIYSMLDYPIRLRGKTIGVICCEQVGRITHWEQEDHTFLKSVANLISLTFEADAREQAEKTLKSLHS